MLASQMLASHRVDLVQPQSELAGYALTSIAYREEPAQGPRSVASARIAVAAAMSESVNALAPATGGESEVPDAPGFIGRR